MFLSTAGTARFPALLLLPVILLGCSGFLQFFGAPPKFVESLDGQYQRLATCTYERLQRIKGAELSIAEVRGQETVRLTLDSGGTRIWEMTFSNELGGRETRLELTPSVTARGVLSTEHALAIARACAA